MQKESKPTAEQMYFARKRNHSIILAARAQAMKREYQILMNTSLKDLIGKKLHVLLFLWLFAHCAQAGTYSTSIGYEINDTAQQPQSAGKVLIGPFYVSTTLIGVQLSCSMAASPIEPLRKGFSEALFQLLIDNAPGAPQLQMGSGPTGIFHGNYGGGGAIANVILKTWYHKEGGAVSQSLYIPLNGLVVPAGQVVILNFGAQGLPSDLEVQGSLQFCQ